MWNMIFVLGIVPESFGQVLSTSACWTMTTLRGHGSLILNKEIAHETPHDLSRCKLQVRYKSRT